MIQLADQTAVIFISQDGDLPFLLWTNIEDKHIVPTATWKWSTTPTERGIWVWSGPRFNRKQASTGWRRPTWTELAQFGARSAPPLSSTYPIDRDLENVRLLVTCGHDWVCAQRQVRTPTTESGARPSPCTCHVAELGVLTPLVEHRMPTPKGVPSTWEWVAVSRLGDGFMDAYARCETVAGIPLATDGMFTLRDLWWCPGVIAPEQTRARGPSAALIARSNISSIYVMTREDRERVFGDDGPGQVEPCEPNAPVHCERCPWDGVESQAYVEGAGCVCPECKGFWSITGGPRSAENTPDPKVGTLTPDPVLAGSSSSSSSSAQVGPADKTWQQQLEEDDRHPMDPGC